jgi:hypothetical protein
MDEQVFSRQYSAWYRSEVRPSTLGIGRVEIVDQPKLIARLRARSRLRGELLEVGILDDLRRDESGRH